MSSDRISIPRGTRDFGPDQMIKRDYIFEIIKRNFKNFGFAPIETPSMENLSVLMGKYGQEGDQLLFKVLNSGDYLKNTSEEDFRHGSKALLQKISEKGLRYDLTVPFARFVVTHQNDIAFPFKRYQIQPVWRADRPQKGRYREFYQCDADVIGTDSLLCEAEMLQMIQQIFHEFGLKNIEIRVNHRGLLGGLATLAGNADSREKFFVILDKLDKIGREKVIELLNQEGFDQERLIEIFDVFDSPQTAILELLTEKFETNDLDLIGINDLKTVVDLVGDSSINIRVDPSLARGLSYYTGIILEVVLPGSGMGSLCGGGRYDNLTSSFGGPQYSGVGFSLGVDRIFDVMNTLDLFPDQESNSTKVLIAPLDLSGIKYGFDIATTLRKSGINSDIYPEPVKIKKQLTYANKRNIPYVIIIGEQEIKSDQLTIKNLNTGDQSVVHKSEVVDFIDSQ